MPNAASTSPVARAVVPGPFTDLTGLTPRLGRSLGQKVAPRWRAFVDTLSASLLATAAHQQAAHDLLGYEPSESVSTREILKGGVSVADHVLHVLATTYAAADRTDLVSVEHGVMSRELGERAGNVPAGLHGVDREVAWRRAIEAFDPVAVGDWLDAKYSDARNHEALVARLGNALRRSRVVARREGIVRLVHRLDAFTANDSNVQSTRALLERIRVAAVLAGQQAAADALAAAPLQSVYDLRLGAKLRWPGVTLVTQLTQVRIEIDQPLAAFVEDLMNRSET